MPRSNRPRRRAVEPAEEIDLGRVLSGTKRVDSKRNGDWNVQPMTASMKTYTCPGCRLEIPARQAHIVAWRADGLMGEADDLAARRHWHSHCWKIEP